MGSISYIGNDLDNKVAVTFDFNGEDITIQAPNHDASHEHAVSDIDLITAIAVLPGFVKAAYAKGYEQGFKDAGLGRDSKTEEACRCNADACNEEKETTGPVFNGLWRAHRQVKQLFEQFPAFANYDTNGSNYGLFAITREGRKPIESIAGGDKVTEFLAIPHDVEGYTQKETGDLREVLEAAGRPAPYEHYGYLDTFAVKTHETPAFKFVYVPANGGAAKAVVVNADEDGFRLESVDLSNGAFTVKNAAGEYRRYKLDNINDGYVWIK